MTALITGEESWLDTPAGRSWAALHRGAPEAYRWAPEEVAADLAHASRVLAAGQIVGPRAYGSSWFGEASSGGDAFRAREVSWADEVTRWPERYLIRRHPNELRALQTWVKSENGERLSPAEHVAMTGPAKTTFYDRRKRGLVIIATELMRLRVENTRPGEAPSDSDDCPSAFLPPAQPQVHAWRAADPRSIPGPEVLSVRMPMMLDRVADIRDGGGSRDVAVRVVVREAVSGWFDGIEEPDDEEEVAAYWSWRAAVARAIREALLAAIDEKAPA